MHAKEPNRGDMIASYHSLVTAAGLYVFITWSCVCALLDLKIDVEISVAGRCGSAEPQINLP